ncbi:hypothetical protein IGI37_000157 [Enterococcus sp. AZ194]|uniref:threonine/serine exporter family protein n=1 Tax=Enterococcus sp. AZ194 TaxID=2774629 RepID=UPI003F200DD6
MGETCLQLIASFLGTISFAILFDAPKKYYIYCGCIGATGWLIYLWSYSLYPSTAIATFTASLILIYLSREVSFRLRAPVTIFLICGIFCLVPGVGIYNFAYSFVTSNMGKFSEYGMTALKIAIAISLGISIGYELPAVCFPGYHARKE